VGNSFSANGVEAFRWTTADGMTGLGGLPGDTFLSGARAVNEDGSVVVGRSRSGAGHEAFRWTAPDGMVGLGHLPGEDEDFDSVALDVSAHGSVIVGSSTSASGQSAFLWTPDLGMVSLQQHLLALGTPGLDGWTLTQALGVSADGRTIVGVGINPQQKTEAWAALLPDEPESAYDCTGDGLVNIDDLLMVISAWGPCASRCSADFDDDGAVDIDDLLLVINNWG
jgi:probable HAF family extracellular repeat protein